MGVVSRPDDAWLRSLVGAEPFTAAGSHADPAVLARKYRALSAGHVAPFEDWRLETADLLRRRGVASAEDHLPHVDPVSGGVHARVVVLHGDSVPCLMAARGGGGLVSQDDGAGPARRLWQLQRSTGLSRAEVVEWNTVPWDPLPGVGPAEARRCLAGWLRLLRRPVRVVLLGAKAQRFAVDVASTLPGCEVLTAPSASRMARITFPDADERIAGALVGGAAVEPAR